MNDASSSNPNRSAIWSRPHAWLPAGPEAVVARAWLLFTAGGLPLLHQRCTDLPVFPNQDPSNETNTIQTCT